MKKYFACKDDEGIYWKNDKGNRIGSGLLEVKYLFAKYNTARDFAERNNLKLVSIFLVEEEEE